MKNADLVNYPNDALAEINLVASRLGVLVHIEGIPFGCPESDPRSSCTHRLAVEDAEGVGAEMPREGYRD